MNSFKCLTSYIFCIQFKNLNFNFLFSFPIPHRHFVFSISFYLSFSCLYILFSVLLKLLHLLSIFSFFQKHCLYSFYFSLFFLSRCVRFSVSFSRYFLFFRQTKKPGSRRAFLFISSTVINSILSSVSLFFYSFFHYSVFQSPSFISSSTICSASSKL